MRRHIPLALASVVLGTLMTVHPTFAAGWHQLTSPTTDGLNGVDCGTASACISVGQSGTVAYTTNSTSWSVGTSGVSVDLYDVDMTSSSTGIAVGNTGTILKTTDGGATWTAKTSGTTEQLHDIFMASSTVGWAAGEDGKVMKTSDGGDSWANVATGSMGDFRAVDATSTNAVWVAGKAGGIYRSTNGGTTWSDVSYATGETIYAIDTLTSTSAIAAGTNGLLIKTTNSGSTWTTLTLPTEFSSTDTIIDLSFYTASAGNAVSNAGDIAITSDTGNTWTSDTADYAGSQVFADAATPSVGVRYAVGANGFVALYDNYGPDAPIDLTVDGDATDADYVQSTTPTLTWTAATDTEGSAITYEYRIDGSAYTATSSTTSQTFSALTIGPHSVELRAVDAAENSGTAASLLFIVDINAPTVGSVTPTTATTGTSTTYTVTAMDVTSGIDVCTLYRDSTAVASMTQSGSMWTGTATTSTAGTYSVYATCYDFAGNSTIGATSTLTVTGASSSDTTAPMVGSVSPTTATQGAARTLSATYSDAMGANSCTLYVNGSNAGAMTLAGSTASKAYTFASSGTYTVYVTCVDAAGNVGSGTSTSVTVTAATETEEEASATNEAQPGDLMKMACGADADVNDPCKAVYYFGADGKRHAFPNEKVYLTWYADFDDVVIVTDDYMASLMLGNNVTYHPGTRLVKFVTVNTVYAVGVDGELRPINSEETVTSIWGSTWNKQVDDISDAFFGNYAFGEVIDSTSDFNPSEVQLSVSSIDDIL